MLVLDLVFIGLAITLEPIPLTAFILLLASDKGVKKAAAFIFGWLLSLAVVVAATVIATNGKPPKSSSDPSLGSLAVKIAIGTALLIFAIRRRHSAGRPKRVKKTPKWQRKVDSMSPWYALVLGPLVQPWGLVAAGVATIMEAKLTSWQNYITVVAFCLIATGTYLAMELYALVRPERTQAFLSSLRAWIDTHTDVVIFWVSLLLGFWLIGKSAYLLVT